MRTLSPRVARGFLTVLTAGAVGTTLLAPTAASAQAAAADLTAAGLAAADQAATDQAAAGPTTAEKARRGELGWGFKQSFRDYVEGPIADGGIEVYEPAVRVEDGTFLWSKGKGQVDTEADTAQLAFKGEVYFYGHDSGSGPMLQIWLDEPRLDIDGDAGVLVADVTSRSMSSGEVVVYDDVELADLALGGQDLRANRKGVVKLSGISSVLTAEGAEAFAGFYSAGTELDPVSFRVKVRS